MDVASFAQALLQDSPEFTWKHFWKDYAGQYLIQVDSMVWRMVRKEVLCLSLSEQGILASTAIVHPERSPILTEQLYSVIDWLPLNHLQFGAVLAVVQAIYLYSLVPAPRQREQV
jgi:hypothetical protein